MRWFYRFLYPFYVVAMRLVSPFVAKVRRGLRGRQGLLERVRKTRSAWNVDPYWFHFASSGEFEQAVPILDSLRERQPESKIFLSYFSPSGKRAVELELQRRQKAGAATPWDGSDYLPYDFPWTVRAYLNALQPRALVILNREFWPELIEQSLTRGIPVSLFAAYFSLRVRRWLWLYRSLLNQLSFIGTVDGPSARLLGGQLHTPVEQLGDPRVERVLSRKQLNASSDIRPQARCFVAASLWPEDFQALKPSLTCLLSTTPGWTIWLVPHEPEEPFLQAIEAWVKLQGVTPHRLSCLHTGDAPRVGIVDSVGQLAELYAQASLAFVGGSFRAKVHNVLEPAAYAVPVITGPFIQNSLEALEMQLESAGFFKTQSAEELATTIKKLLETEAVQAEGLKALAFLERRQGIAAAYAQRLLT